MKDSSPEDSSQNISKVSQLETFQAEEQKALEFAKFLNQERTPQTTYWEILPWLHLGFALFSLIYLPLSFMVIQRARVVLERPEINEILHSVYGTDFLWLFGENALLKWVSIVLIILTSLVNLWGAYVIKVSGSRKSAQDIKRIKRLAWFNIGMPPWGTALALICFNLIKKDVRFFKKQDLEKELLQDAEILQQAMTLEASSPSDIKLNDQVN